MKSLNFWTIILFVLILFAKTLSLFYFVIHQAPAVLHSPNDIWPQFPRLYTGLWLDNTDHVTSTLAPDWPRLYP